MSKNNQWNVVDNANINLIVLWNKCFIYIYVRLNIEFQIVIYLFILTKHIIFK